MIFGLYLTLRKSLLASRLLLASVLLFLGLIPVHAQEIGQDSTDNKVYLFVDEMPVFPGNLNAWLYNHVKYPEAAKKKGIEGRVYVRFIIEKDGSISDVRLLRGVSPELDKEAKDVVASMPLWHPGKLHHLPARVYYTLPIYFALRSTAPPVERRTFERYLKALEKAEGRLKNGTDSVSASSGEMYRLYLKKRYATDEAAYKGIVASAREQQQSSEIMLSIAMLSTSLPVADKNKILTYYKEEWDEQIRLIDSLPEKSFIAEYVQVTPRFQENKIVREIKIRDYLGLKKYRRYVEDCIFSPGKWIGTVIANPVAGKWEKILENGVEVKQSIQKEYYDDFSFVSSDGTKGVYKLSGGLLEESSEAVQVKNVVEYSARYQLEANNRILVIAGEIKLKLADGTFKNEQVKETWRRIE